MNDATQWNSGKTAMTRLLVPFYVLSYIDIQDIFVSKKVLEWIWVYNINVISRGTWEWKQVFPLPRKPSGHIVHSICFSHNNVFSVRCIHNSCFSIVVNSSLCSCKQTQKLFMLSLPVLHSYLVQTEQTFFFCIPTQVGEANFSVLPKSLFPVTFSPQNKLSLNWCWPLSLWTGTQGQKQNT